jgi:hypothetical protein
MAGTSHHPEMRRLALARLLPVVVLVAGCGTRGDAEAAPPVPSAEAVTTGTPASAAAALPDCSDLWVVGQRLPEDYAGCQESGVPADDTTVPCAIGDVLIEHGEGYYATPGRPIRLAADGFAGDAAYQRVHTICTG